MNDELRMVREFYAEVPPAPGLQARIRNRLADAEAGRGGRMIRFPRPALLLAGVTAASVLAVGGVAVLSGTDGTRGPAVTVAPEAPVNARSFLLASAQKAERAPAVAGRYWYTRERTSEQAGAIIESKGRKVKNLKPPFTATLSHTQESWTARDAKDRTRSIVGIDRKYTFSSTADEAKWKEMGSPQLGWVPAKPQVNNYDGPIRFTIGQKQLTMQELVKLPTDAAKLSSELRRRYKADVNDPKYPLQDSYLQYVWSTAQDLLAGPITPGTKAALYRVLAEQKGIRLVGKVTDPLGRPGMALAYTDGKSASHVGGQGSLDEYRLIIDPQSAQLLAYEARGRDYHGKPAVLLSMAYQSMGWVQSLGARP